MASYNMHGPRTMRGIIILPLLLLLNSIPSVLSSNPKFINSPHSPCPGGLKCHHGGVCAAGDKDHSLDLPPAVANAAGKYLASNNGNSNNPFALGKKGDVPWLEELNVNGEHCTDCHDGWGGVDCSRKYEHCDAADSNAPTCFNGGSCYKMGIDAVTGRYDYMCDCTSATHMHDGVRRRYSGRYCQHLAEVKCDDEMFCTNGGTCKGVANDVDVTGVYQHFECECPADRAGTHCEFLKEDGLSASSCHLECARGTCAKGFKSFEELIGTGPFPAALAFDVISRTGEHCVCPDGYTGLRCEIEVRRCGPKKYCYNGSTCAYDESGEPLCDCNSAHTDEVSYAGVSCEQESTSRCTPGLDQDQKDAFCTNHGRCITDQETRHEGCICDAGWTGDLCDIKGDVEPVCDLDCRNGGSCRLGVKGYKDSYDEMSLPVHAKKHEDGMYCSCPDGFTGLKCEVDINKCHDYHGNELEQSICLNGATCDVDENIFDPITNLPKFDCKCDEAGRDGISKQLAGRFCEYAVTEFCAEDSARHSHSFCTNGGRCKKYSGHGDSEHHGCCCPDGYEGEYCQLPKGTLDASVPITWSPMEECKHIKKPASKNAFPMAMPVSPNSDGNWDHIYINPKYQVPDDEILPHHEVKDPVVQSEKESEDESNKTGGTVTGVLVSLLLVGVFAGVVYRRRNTKEKGPQFESEWWRGHAPGSEWWKGADSDIEPDTNIAPAKLERSWSYPEETRDTRWEYNADHGDLHDVVI